jgi:hypothetical protein
MHSEPPAPERKLRRRASPVLPVYGAIQGLGEQTVDRLVPNPRESVILVRIKPDRHGSTVPGT